jgi:hypothetical protein
LDSSYLLPFCGIDIKLKDFKTIFEAVLQKCTFIINICSFIEIKWVLFHFIRKNPEKKTDFLNRYQEALLYFSKTPQFKLVSFLDLEIDAFSNENRDAGLLDYFDATICATAQVHEAPLLTEDAVIYEKSLQKSIPIQSLDWNTFIAQL